MLHCQCLIFIITGKLLNNLLFWITSFAGFNKKDHSLPSYHLRLSMIGCEKNIMSLQDEFWHCKIFALLISKKTCNTDDMNIYCIWTIWYGRIISVWSILSFQIWKILLVLEMKIEMKLFFPLKYEFDDGIKVAQALK